MLEFNSIRLLINHWRGVYKQMNKIKMIPLIVASLSLPLLTSFSVYALGNGKNGGTNPNMPSNDSSSSSLLPNVSYDRFGDIKKSGKSIYGDGSGDLILFMLDESGNTPRKKSIMIDLHTTQDNKMIDLTANDLLSRSGRFDIESNDLSYFINQSKDPGNLKWLVVAVVNHNKITPTNLPAPPKVLELVNNGLIISTQNKIQKAMTFKEIKSYQSIFTYLIKSNNEYGIGQNSGLTSVSNEPSFLDITKYGLLPSGTPTFAKLHGSLSLGFHRNEKNITFKPLSYAYKTSYQTVGEIELTLKSNSEWVARLTIK